MLHILSKTNEEAKAYFLQSSSYSSIHLPEYFDFQPLLTALGESGKLKGGLNINEAKKYSDINYKFLTNKDGKYAWRPFQLIHPAIYVHLVNQITSEKNWIIITESFQKFQENKNIECCSILFSNEKQETILNWWENIEQKSLEYSLYYDCFLNTDIVDCYSSIYTHSIPWALHGKEKVKQDFLEGEGKGRNGTGDVIDKIIQSMQYGQTNGIPQGSALMDFIAEIVLGYADAILSTKITNYNSNQKNKIENYKILRYRDDYRIFAENQEVVTKIAKLLSETLMILNLKLNTQKTFISDNIVRDAIKPDKYFWNASKQGEKTLQKHLLIIHALAEKYPNSGSLQKALNNFLKRVTDLKQFQEGNSEALVGILIAIAFQNPRTYPTIVAILSKILSLEIDLKKKENILKGIENKFEKIPNTGHLQIWLQRLTYKENPNKKYTENLCQKVTNPEIKIWNNKWLNENLKEIFEQTPIINTEKLNEMPKVIELKEVDFFSKY